MKKILIIDDERPTLKMFRLFLRAYGYEVLTAENGDAGLEIFRSEKPDMVFSDIKMPGLDGLRVLERIKSSDPDIPVVVITGHGDTDLAQQAMALNATAFLHKPIQRQALEEALEKAEKALNPSPGET